MRIMMSAANSPVAPSILQYIRNLGHYVVGHDCVEHGPGPMFSDEFIRSPKVGHDYLGWFLNQQFDLYIPFLDEELLLVSAFGKVVVSPPAAISIFTSKGNQQIALEDAGLPIAPRTGPIIIKPDHGRGGKGIIHLDTVPDHIVQYKIKGQEYSVDVLTDFQGNFLYAMPRKRLAVSGGVSVIAIADMDDEIIDLCRSVTSRFQFRGPINIQIIRSIDTGKLYIIEVNPRFSGSIMFTIMSGFDILRSTIEMWEGKPFVPPKKIYEYPVRRYYREERL